MKYIHVVAPGKEITLSTFRREHAVLVVSGVEHLGIELLWDGVDARDLVYPCAIAHNHSISVCFVSCSLFMKKPIPCIKEHSICQMMIEIRYE